MVSVLLSASVERFFVSRMRDFFVFFHKVTLVATEQKRPIKLFEKVFVLLKGKKAFAKDLSPQREL